MQEVAWESAAMVESPPIMMKPISSSAGCRLRRDPIPRGSPVVTTAALPTPLYPEKTREISGQRRWCGARMRVCALSQYSFIKQCYVFCCFILYNKESVYYYLPYYLVPSHKGMFGLPVCLFTISDVWWAAFYYIKQRVIIWLYIIYTYICTYTRDVRC